jgi:hypothetical protein
VGLTKDRCTDNQKGTAKKGHTLVVTLVVTLAVILAVVLVVDMVVDLAGLSPCCLGAWFSKDSQWIG